MDFDHAIWKSAQGGYKIPYDASIPLKKLESATSKEQIKSVFDELWNELHHQGDVGLASYLALPHLVRIAKEKDLFDWNILGICAVIEQQRHLGNNPKLPVELTDYYQNGLNQLKLCILANIGKQLDHETFRVACSTLATVAGQIKLGKAIIELDESTMDEFLEQF